MNLSSYYLFGSGFSKTSVCVSNEMLDFDTACKIVKSDFTDIELPIVLYQFSGRIWTDVLNPSSVSMYIVSNKFIELLRKNKITGWESYEVKIYDKKEGLVTGYAGLSIVGKCGTIDYSKSEIYEKQLVPNGTKNKYYKGLHIGLDKWDRSDFFIPEKTLHIIITERVREIIIKHKITNVVLQNLEEYEIVDFAIPK